MKKMAAEYEAVIASLKKKDKGGNKGGTRYQWGIRASAINLVYFIYDKGSRSRKVILDFLKDFIGTIQTDGATMYKIFEEKMELGITRLSCLIHIRRYFHKALKFEDETGIARWFLERIKLIYKFEKQYRKDNLSPETIKTHRQTDILPIFGDIYQKLTLYANNVTCQPIRLLGRPINKRLQPKPYNRQFHATSMAETVITHIKKL